MIPDRLQVLAVCLNWIAFELNKHCCPSCDESNYADDGADCDNAFASGRNSKTHEGQRVMKPKGHNYGHEKGRFEDWSVFDLSVKQTAPQRRPENIPEGKEAGMSAFMGNNRFDNHSAIQQRLQIKCDSKVSNNASENPHSIISLL